MGQFVSFLNSVIYIIISPLAYQIIKKHNEEYQRRQKLVEEQKSSVKKYNGITDELRAKLLDENIRKCLHIKEVLLADQDLDTFPVLSLDQEAKVDIAFDRRLEETQILVTEFNLKLKRSDLLTLSGLTWLNDEVINFYMNLIIERGKMKGWPKAYAFNTFFYQKVSAGGQSSVRRWTRKIDIFSYDIVAVPIHLRLHWCMAIMDFRAKTICYYDSMGSSNRPCLETLLRYLEDECEDKKKTKFPSNEWKLSSVKDIPQQMNGSDCGVFACAFAEVLTRDGKINFSQEDMPYLRRKMVVEILECRLLIS